MPSYMTVNKIGADGKICKYDVFKTLEQAEARITELHEMPGYEGAFIVDADAAAHEGQRPFQEPTHFAVNVTTKRVSVDPVAIADTALRVATKEWQKELEELDTMLSRSEEDAYNAQPVEIQANYPAAFRARVVEKETLRAAKPV